MTRRLRFDVAAGVAWLVEPLLRRRLPGEVRDELRRAKQHLEGEDGP